MGGTALRLFIASTLLGGCGSVKDSGTGVDAQGPQDAGPDADETGTATVITEAAVFGGTAGQRVGNIEIVSMLPNNTVLESKLTDAAGSTTIKVYPGGTVTAVYKHTADMGVELITWVGVQPDDTLNFGLRQFVTPSPTPPSLGSQTYQFTPQPNATEHRVCTSCTSACRPAPAGVTSVTIAESPTCHQTPMDVLFVAVSGTNPSVVSHYRLLSNQAFTPGGSITIPAGASVAQQVSANINGLPAEVVRLQGRLGVVLDNTTENSLPGGSFSGAPTGGAFASTLPWATTGDRTVATLSLEREGPYFPTVVIDGLPASSTTWTVASPELPPWMETQFLSSVVDRRVTWSVLEQSGTTHDAVVVGFAWNRSISNTTHRYQWNFVMPPNTTEVVLPNLPAQFDEYVPRLQDAINLNRLRAVEIPAVTNYDAIRAMPAANVVCVECAVRAGEIQRAIYAGG